MVTVYSKPACPQCNDTKTMLNSLGVEFTEVDMSRDPAALKKVMSLGHRSAPVVMTAEGDSWAGFKRDKIEALASAGDSAFDDIYA